MENMIAVLVIVILVGSAAAYLIKAKRSGVKCVGCPAGGNCSSKNKKKKKKRKKESDKINNGFKFVDVENNLYSGLLYCGRCGTPMYKRKGNTGTRKRPDSYLCKKYSNEGAIKDIRPNYGCKPHRIRIEYLDKIVNAYIDNLVSNPEFKNFVMDNVKAISTNKACLLYTSPSPRD